MAGLLAASLLASVMAAWAAPAELPRTWLDTTYVPPTGRLIAVPAGGNFQAALDEAQPGDVITLQAGATFTGNFTLPAKAGSDWIVIRSSAPDSSLPAPGTRIAPAHACALPKIVSPNTLPALAAAPNSHHYRLIGVEITGTVADTSETQLGLVALDFGTDFVLDRAYIHGTPAGNYKQGVRLNNARTAVIDSYLADFHSVDQDAQAIGGWNGPGPFKIVNNYLEASGENLLFGGADPLVADLVPGDIEIRRNHVVKPLAWRVGDPSYAGIHWIVKNLLELKNARRVLIDGNLFEHTWQDAQDGPAVLLTVRNQGGTAPWSVVEDVTFTNNIVRHAGSGIAILGRDDLFPSQPTKRIVIRNNLFDDVSSVRWGGAGHLVGTAYGIEDLVIDHNTGLMDQAIMNAGPPGTSAGFVYTNNLTPVGAYGFTGVGTIQGTHTLDTYFPGAVFARNVLAGPWERGDPSLYPPDNFFPASLAEVAFVDLAAGNHRLAASSPYKNAGTDGRDIGADIDAIEAAVAGVPGLIGPEFPRVVMDTTYVPPTGATIAVPAGGDFQAALDLAQPGDVITLEVGATYTGNFTLPNKPGTGWIVIRTSALDASLPPPGTRITPTYAGVLPKIVSPNDWPAVMAAPGAHHYRFLGVEFSVGDAVGFSHALILSGLYETTLDQLPHHLVFDRVYVHGTPTANVRRGIVLNSAWTAVIDSYIADIHEVGLPAQGITGWNGPGPFKLVNNRVEAAGTGILFSDASPLVTGLVPADMEIRGNHVVKPLAWRSGDPGYAGIPWTVGSLLELTNVRRVLIDGNVFEQTWLDAGMGLGIVLAVRNADGTAPWSVVEDVTITNNIVRHVGSGIGLKGRDGYFPSGPARRILIANNLLDDVSGARWGGPGMLFLAFEGIEDLVIDHNTGFQDSSILYSDGLPHPRFVYRNNLVLHNAYGIHGTGTAPGIHTLATYFPGYGFEKNVLVGADPSVYPPGNFFPASSAEVGFVDLAGGQYRLAPASPYRNSGSDGRDIGADFNVLEAATAGATAGSRSSACGPTN